MYRNSKIVHLTMKISGIVKLVLLSVSRNRIRSPSLESYGLRENVDEGSRQIRSVTSGEGLALRAGRMKLCGEGLRTVGARILTGQGVDTYACLELLCCPRTLS